MNNTTDPVRALIADLRESAAGAKRYSTTDYEDGYAAAERNCANRLEAALAQQPAIPEGWERLAAEWLERRAAEQEATNTKYPRHAAAYKEWRDRPGILRMLAQQVVSAADPVTGVKRNCPPPSWMFTEDERAAAQPSREGAE